MFVILLIFVLLSLMVTAITTNITHKGDTYKLRVYVHLL